MAHLDLTNTAVVADILEAGKFEAANDFSVLTYGAIGDGTVDDSGAIQAAIDAAELLAPATVFFPAGTYKVTTAFTVTAALTLTGTHNTIIDDQRPAASAEYMFTVSSDDVTFSHLTFSGSNATGTNTTRHICIYAFQVARIKVHDCRFVNLTRVGTADAGGTASTLSEYAIIYEEVTDGRIVDCTVKELSGVGFFIETSNRVWVERNHIAMLSTGDCLYPIHVRDDTTHIWINENVIVGGSRRSGGVIDLMSLDGPTKYAHITNNIIDNCDGTGSALAVIRVLSADSCVVTGNIVRGITDDDAIHILVEHRDLPSAQLAPRNTIIADNILVAGGVDQRGIDVRNTNASSDMFNITISGNILDTDGSKWFGAGIRLHDAWRGRIIGNTVVYKYSAGTTSSWGIEAAEVTLSAMTYVLIADNYVDCLSSATSRAIQVTGLSSPRQGIL